MSPTAAILVNALLCLGLVLALPLVARAARRPARTSRRRSGRSPSTL